MGTMMETLPDYDNLLKYANTYRAMTHMNTFTPPIDKIDPHFNTPIGNDLMRSKRETQTIDKQQPYSNNKEISTKKYNLFTQVPELLGISSGFLFVVLGTNEMPLHKKAITIFLFIVLITLIIESKYVKMKNLDGFIDNKGYTITNVQ